MQKCFLLMVYFSGWKKCINRRRAATEWYILMKYLHTWGFLGFIEFNFKRVCSLTDLCVISFNFITLSLFVYRRGNKWKFVCYFWSRFFVEKIILRLWEFFEEMVYRWRLMWSLVELKIFEFLIVLERNKYFD